MGLFDSSYYDVHIDERWFFVHKVKTGIVLHLDEPKRVQKCQSKRFVPTIMFMAAVACPRPGFDGLIGIFEFTEFNEAKRSSYRRKKGTMEQVSIARISNVEHKQMLVNQMILAIKAKFPWSSENQTISI